MSFDLSRVSFDAHRDFLGVIQAQGRVGLDADWNEWVAQLLRRLQVGTLDALDGTAVPRTTPQGFEISWDKASSRLSIGPGRIYVDGVLAENHGADPAVWDPLLAELTGSKAVAFDRQPYQPYLKDDDYLKKQLPTAYQTPATGPCLVYLDVWQREITSLQEPRLIEPAVGEDTTGRLQTVWQVKLLPATGSTTFSCASKDEEIPGWKQLITPVPVRLSTRTADPPVVENPCDVAAEAGYSGLENQLYRVEVHKPGPLGTATLKWSRDNGSIASAVTHIDPSRVTLTVTSLGRDAVLGFRQGDWVEVSDDWRVLAGQPGELRRIKDIHEPTLQLELDQPLTDGLFATDAKGAPDPKRHTLVRRWDNDPNDPDGGLPIPAAGEWLKLEHGIEVQIVLDPSPKPGEPASIPAGAHWVFAARTSTGALLDPLAKAPPLGVHHHYARLAVVDFGKKSVSDCRRLWPPELAGGGCDCTVCVTPEGHGSGKATLQMAIEQVKAKGGGTVCLEVGVYWLQEPLQVEKAQSLRIRGQGWATQLLGQIPGPVMELAQCNGVTLENLFLIGSVGPNEHADFRSAMLLASDVADLRVLHCTVVGVDAGSGTSVGIGLNGTMLACAIRECTVVASHVVARVSVPDRTNLTTSVTRPSLFTAGLRLEQNVFLANMRCVGFDGQSFHQGHTILRDNLLVASNPGRGVAIEATGGVLPDSVFRIEGNLIDSCGDGVMAGVDGLVISGNRITGHGGESRDAIQLLEGLDPRGPRQVSVLRNRIQTFGRDAVRQVYRIGRLEVSDNQVEQMGEGALVMGEAARADHLVCRDNQFTGLGLKVVEGKECFAAVQLLAIGQAEVRGNQIREVAVEGAEMFAIDGLRVLAVADLQVTGNRFEAIGPQDGRVRSTCLRVVKPFDRVLIQGNRMAQMRIGEQFEGPPVWSGVQIGEDLPARFPYRSLAQVLPQEHGQGLFYTGAQVRLMEKGARDVTLRGNNMEAVASAVPLLEAEGIGHGSLSNSILRQQQEPKRFLAYFDAESISISDNMFQCPSSENSAALEVNLPSRRPALITGNTSTGRFDIPSNLTLPANIRLTNLLP